MLNAEICGYDHAASCGARKAKEHVAGKRSLKQQHSATDDNLESVAQHLLDQKFLPGKFIEPLILCKELHEHLG